MVGGCRVGFANNKESWQKMVLMHQLSMCEFQIELKFGTEKKGAGRNIELTLWEKKENSIKSTCIYLKNI